MKLASPFFNIVRTLVIKKESDINIKKFQFIAEGSKDNATLPLYVLGFSDLSFFSLNSARELSFTPPPFFVMQTLYSVTVYWMNISFSIR